jgi:hypothetical protein
METFSAGMGFFLRSLPSFSLSRGYFYIFSDASSLSLVPKISSAWRKREKRKKQEVIERERRGEGREVEFFPYRTAFVSDPFEASLTAQITERG